MDQKVVGTETRVLTNKSAEELRQAQDFYELFKNAPIPGDLLLNNLGLFLQRTTLSRILFLNELYKKILDIQGVIFEFGVFYGQNLALFESFRGLYEPYNYPRKIVGFDTFEGFLSPHEKDGSHDITREGSFATTQGYEEYLAKVLEHHETLSPISHLKKFELVKGDATDTIKQYLTEHPETIIALAYFDFDLYEPTKACLEAILPHLTKGAIIAFDELNYPAFPGETRAFNEVLGINNYKIYRDKYHTWPSWIVYE